MYPFSFYILVWF